MSNYRYQIEQYHSIGKADIAINGISVLAGVNGAGKSTLARWLYYIVNIATTYEINRFEEFQQVIAIVVEQLVKAKKELSGPSDNAEETLDKAKRKIVRIQYSGIESVDDVLHIYNAATKHFCADLKSALPQMSQNDLNRILNFLHVEHQADKEDNQWIKSLYSEMISEGEELKKQFLLRIKKRSIDKFYDRTRRTYHELDTPEYLSFQEDGVEIITEDRIGSLLALNDAIFIDTPMALSVTDSTNHFWNELQFMLKYQNDSLENSSEVRSLLKHIKKITGGEVVEKKDIVGQEELFYKRQSDSLTIKLEDVATGIKTFAYIEQLLRKGYLTNHTILIIDEPEAHLHPQWIVEFARLLVLLNKEIGLKIMIASHDPDMVSAIRYVAEAEEVLDNTRFYLAERDGDSQTYTYKDLDKDIEPIFVSFNKSFELIEKYGVDNGKA